MANWSKLSNKIILTAGVSVTLALSGMISFIAYDSYQSTRRTTTDLIRSESAAFADSVKSTIEAGFQIPYASHSAMVGLREANALTRDSMTAVLKSQLNAAPNAIGTWALFEPNAFDGKDNDFRLDWPKHDPSGRYTPYLTKNASGQATVDVLMSTDRVKAFPEWKDKLTEYKPDYDKPGWGDFYYVPKSRNKDTITEPFFYEVQGKKVLESSMVMAVHAPNGQFAGVFAADVALDTFQKQFGGKQIEGKGYATLISEGGMYVVNPDKSKLGQAIDKADPVKSYLDKKEQQPFMFEDGDNTKFYYPIKIGTTDQTWYANITVPTAFITESAVVARNKAIGIGVVATLLIIGLLAMVTIKLTRPLNALAESMETLAQGTGDLTARIPVINRDEIGRTATAFNQFIESLQAMFIDVRQRSHQLIEATRDINDAAATVTNASERQSDASSATAAGVEQVTVSVHHIADTASEAADIARNSGDTTQNTVRTVENLMNEFKKITHDMQTITQRITSLGDRSKEVTSIVMVIKDIADQTNLLALNAAIEAARAGEQGRGFAVVADEVRKLAARTAEATVKITQIVESMGTETQAAVNEVVRSNKTVTESVAVAVAANEGMSEVKKQSELLVQSISEIAASTREQSIAASEIAQNVEQISAMAQSNAMTISDVRSATESLHQLAADLEAKVNSFRLE